ncbi:MAG: adenine nucleotide alpha hydrolase [Nitrospirae bacterium]|nr:adenine nucleotide alpha hydrolase [Nitrospirota bacterium]
MRKKTLLSWSSGKDSAWALHLLRQRDDIEVVGLFTTVNAEFQRVAMHAVRLELLKRQAEAVGLPLETLNIPNPCSNLQYESVMKEFVERSRESGIACMAFGDLFLQDIRSYREAKLKDTGITPLFPLWEIPTDRLARQMISEGLRAYLTCVDPKKLPARFAGREFGPSLLDELPESVDPCGENGEFHTFAVDGPMFRAPVKVNVGEVVERDGFVFADLHPREALL